MAGNSQRRGAVRKSGSKKGATVGSGGQRRKGLEPKGPTPKAIERTGHPAARRKARAERSRDSADRRRSAPAAEAIVGRNAVTEALAAGVPASALHVLDTIEPDDRVRAALQAADRAGLAILTATRAELDRAAGNSHHQGLVLATESFGYADVADFAPGASGVIVALDHITDPQNLGAIVRSAGAFAADGVIVPQRRSAPVTAAAWKASAGALARTPVARVGNLVQTLTELQRQGYFVLGLDGEADTEIAALSEALATGPLVLVVGAEGSGLARLTAATCDLLVGIPMVGGTESLNASVAAGIALFEVARRRSG
jgi:23S rRNA (guanosine2251-2'-O)-methyltransferase